MSNKINYNHKTLIQILSSISWVSTKTKVRIPCFKINCYKITSPSQVPKAWGTTSWAARPTPSYLIPSKVLIRSKQLDRKWSWEVPLKSPGALTQTRSPMRKVCAITATTREENLKWRLLVGTQTSPTTRTAFVRTATWLNTTRREKQSNSKRPWSRKLWKKERAPKNCNNCKSPLRPLRSNRKENPRRRLQSHRSPFRPTRRRMRP